MPISQDTQIVYSSRAGESVIRKTPGVCGGDACIGDSRIMVWLLVAMQRRGLSDQQILAGFPTLTLADLAAAWEYNRRQPDEIDDAIATQETDD